jgi:multiple sugar transport system substrate-binding protein
VNWITAVRSRRPALIRDVERMREWSMRRGIRRFIQAGSAGVLVAGVLAACSGSSGPPTLTWFINPDNGGQVKLAAECTAAAKGAYKITTSLLPTDATQQRQQLVTRLSAKDSSISLMSVDPIYLPELSEAGFLAKVPAADVTAFEKNVFKPAIAAASWQGKLIAAPFTSNVQLLWYRKQVAQDAGLDMTKPVTWDQIIDAAKKEKKTVALQADLYEGYAVWINALILGAGGHIVENPGAQAKDIKLGVNSAAGKKAAAIIEKVVKEGVGGPALSTSEEGQAQALFQDPKNSGFMVNYPFIWAALSPAQKKTVGFTLYPETQAGTPSKPPFGGIDIAVGNYTSHKDLAFQAAQCITSAPHLEQYMVAEGNPSANETVYTKPDILKAFPNGLAAMIKKSLSVSGPRPQTQYYGDLSGALQQKFSPPDSVNSSTPKKAQDFILSVLKGDKLL